MARKFFRKIFRLIQYPMTAVMVYREFWDRRSRQKRIDSARRLLEQNNVLSLLASGNELEIPPQLPDLANLYNLIRERRPKIVLEFGIGFSTLVIASALRDNLLDQNLRG
jgi:predicted O-methyltransferase YrrM